MRTRVKFCGFKRVDQALQACDLGVDAIGLVFHPASARYIEPQAAAAIAKAVPAFVMRVGVFKDAEPAFIESVLKTVPLDRLQFHGAETVETCECYGLAYIKAFCMQPTLDFQQLLSTYTTASAIMLDDTGGSGRSFDWSQIPRQLINVPLILAGGLNSENVGQAIKTVKPYAVDVSSGIEFQKGEKSLEKMQAFMHEVANV